MIRQCNPPLKVVHTCLLITTGTSRLYSKYYMVLFKTNIFYFCTHELCVPFVNASRTPAFSKYFLNSSRFESAACNVDKT